METMGNPDDHLPHHSPSALPRGAAGTRLTAALSLSIHALLLALLMRVTALPGPLDLPPHMGVDIVRVALPQPETAKTEEEKAKPSPPDPPAPIAKPVAAPHPASAPKPVIAAPPTPQPISTPPEGQGDAATASVVSTPPPPPPAGGGGAPDDSLRQYGQLVWSRIAAHKPRGMRLPGTATVTFAIAPDGGVLSASVTVSDGSPLLNEIALETVRAAAPFPLPPPGSSPAQLIFAIPFHFR